MFIYHKWADNTHFPAEASTVVYIPPKVAEDYNHASLSIWIVPGTATED